MKFKLLIIILLLNFSLANGDEKKVDQNTIHKNLRCLVCQGQSIADSNSDFAQTIKLVVKDLIKDGKTEREIYAFMADKYGDWIVFKPQVIQAKLYTMVFTIFSSILGGGYYFPFLF